MSTVIVSNEQDTRPSLDEEFGRVVITDPFDPKVLPDNKLVKDYLADGYELKSDFRTRNRDEAKDLAKELRKDGTKLTAYITLLGGWFGVLLKDAPEKKASALSGKKDRPEISFEFGDRTWKSTKEARAYARLLIEAAKQAEFDYDVEQAELRKAERATE